MWQKAAQLDTFLESAFCFYCQCLIWRKKRNIMLIVQN